ncbi:MAG: hypothetical protein JNL32_07685 [Candidatus Kapabacteria bacterium]|nr:hypothetical protein [Candidatus Kapabacteria bacterium]
MTPRARLNQQLFFACKKLVTPGFGDEDEAWRIIRESAVEAVTNRTRPQSFTDYERCNEKELQICINYLEHGEEALPQKSFPRDEPITAAQKRKLHSISMECGLYYARWDNYQTVNTVTGEILSGADAREKAFRLWKTNQLRGALSQHIYTTWINPRLYQMLVDGGFRQHVPKASYYMDWHKITQREATYLIQRFSKIYTQIVERYATPLNAPLHMSFSEN